MLPFRDSVDPCNVMENSLPVIHIFIVLNVKGPELSNFLSGKYMTWNQAEVEIWIAISCVSQVMNSPQ